MNHKGTITLETERLILRRFKPDDAEAVFLNWAGDPEATRFMPLERASSVDEAWSLVSKWSDTVFAVVLKSTGELIGLVEYDVTDEEARVAELVYIIGKKWWHNGFVAEALSALLKHAFEEAKLNRVWACYDPRNPNSGAVMRKCRMRFEGFSRQCKIRDGELVDRYYYAILAEDYFAGKPDTTADKRNELTKAIFNTAHLTGTFTLRSGQVSNEYFDKYLFEANPVLLADIAAVMKRSVPAGTEVLAGLEMGGIPVATAISLQTGVPAAFVRKKAKEYGTCKLAEGADVSGKRVCIIEDVVTTGGAIIDGVRELRKLGAVIDTVLCVILRNDNATDILAEHGLKLIPAFTMEEILGIAR